MIRLTKELESRLRRYPGCDICKASLETAVSFRTDPSDWPQTSRARVRALGLLSSNIQTLKIWQT